MTHFSLYFCDLQKLGKPLFSLFLAVLVSSCAQKNGTSFVEGPADAGPATVEVRVGEQGGKIVIEGAVLEIPPGAVDAGVQIRVTATTESAPRGFTNVTPVFKFEPEGLHFAIPVKVTLDVPPSAPAELNFYWSKDGTQGYDELSSTREGQAMSASVTHFSFGFLGFQNALVAPRALGIKPVNGFRYGGSTSDGSLYLAISGGRFLVLDEKGIQHASYEAPVGEPMPTSGRLSDDGQYLVTWRDTGTPTLHSIRLSDGLRTVLANGNDVRLSQLSKRFALVTTQTAGLWNVSALSLDGSQRRDFGNASGLRLVEDQLFYTGIKGKLYWTALGTNSGDQLLYTTADNSALILQTLDRPTQRIVLSTGASREIVFVHYGTTGVPTVEVITRAPMIYRPFVGATQVGLVSDNSNQLILQRPRQVDQIIHTHGLGDKFYLGPVSQGGKYVFWSEQNGTSHQFFAARLEIPLKPKFLFSENVGMGHFEVRSSVNASVAVFTRRDNLAAYGVDTDVFEAGLIMQRAAASVLPGLSWNLRGNTVYFQVGSTGIQKVSQGQPITLIPNTKGCRLVGNGEAPFVLHDCGRGLAVLDAADVQKMVTPVTVSLPEERQFTEAQPLRILESRVFYSGYSSTSDSTLHTASLDPVHPLLASLQDAWLSFPMRFEALRFRLGKIIFTEETGGDLTSGAVREWDLQTNTYRTIVEDGNLAPSTTVASPHYVFVNEKTSDGGVQCDWVDLASGSKEVMGGACVESSFFMKPFIALAHPPSGATSKTYSLIRLDGGVVPFVTLSDGLSNVLQYVSEDGQERLLVNPTDSNTLYAYDDEVQLKSSFIFPNDGGVNSVTTQAVELNGRLHLSRASFQGGWKDWVSFAATGGDFQQHHAPTRSGVQFCTEHGVTVETSADGQTLFLAAYDMRTLSRRVLWEQAEAKGALQYQCTLGGVLITAPDLLGLLFDDFSGGAPKVLAPLGEVAKVLAIEPESKRVAFAHATPSSSRFSLVVVDLDTSERRVVLDGASGYRLGAAAFGAQGKSIVYSASTADDTDSDVWFVQFPD